jgi:long-chain acyl-CoA synthetase
MSDARKKIATLIDLYDAVVADGLPNLLNDKRDGRWQAISAGEMAVRVRAIASGLQSLGVRPGAHIALLSENRPEWTITDFAILNSGAADVPIHTTLAVAQVAYVLNDAQVEILFLSGQSQYDRVRESFGEIPGLKTIITFDPVTTDDARVMSLVELERRGREADATNPQRFDETRRSVRPETLATLIYTSGTTGEPKGVMLSHQNLASNAVTCAMTLPINRGDAVLSFLPLSHIFERTGFYFYLHRSAAIHYAESVDKVTQNLREVSPYFMTSVPRLFEKIHATATEKAEKAGGATARIAAWAEEVAQQWAAAQTKGGANAWLNFKRSIAVRLVFSKWQQAMGGKIRCFISGGAPLSVELAQTFYGAGMPILQGYGLTESSPVISANTAESHRLGSVGKPIPGVEVRIAEDGEVLCCGPNVMQGYYNKPEETARTLEKDGQGRVWLRTGDIGHFDADGYLFITDRKKDLIKTSNGKYIAPQPIENDIRRSRFVNQAVVIGDQRKFPIALIYPQLEALQSYAQLKNINCKSTEDLLRHPRILDLLERQVEKFTPTLADYEKVKAVGIIEKELTIDGGELTPTLKVRRRVVMEKYKSLIESVYAGQESRHAKAETH